MEDTKIKQVINSVCIRCNRERKIYCKQICKSCYSLLHYNKEKHKEYVKKWNTSHPDYFRNYYKLKHPVITL